MLKLSLCGDTGKTERQNIYYSLHYFILLPLQNLVIYYPHPDPPIDIKHFEIYTSFPSSRILYIMTMGKWS